MTNFQRLIGILSSLFLFVHIAAAQSYTCWFTPDMKDKAALVKEIADVLSSKTGYEIKPRIAENYPQIVGALGADEPALLFGGSFVQSLLVSRGKVKPLVQGVNGKEMYSGIMVLPKGSAADAILKNSPEQVAYALGASSGESSARAASGGKAGIGVPNHQAAVNAVMAGKASAAFVKNWWWEANGAKYPTLEVFKVPGVSEEKNPDNILSASEKIPADAIEKIKAAALSNSQAFGMKEMTQADDSKLAFSIGLMRKGGIDPLSYSW